MSTELQCALAGRCSGCPWIGQTHADQLARKQADLRALWTAAGIPDEPLGSLTFLPIAPGGLRDRVELSFRGGDRPRFGLYATGDDREIVDICECPQLSPELQAWLSEFRKLLPLIRPPIRIGSVRLRISPRGERGAWLDFSHQDVKALMADGGWLERLFRQAIVEVGQRRKRLVRKEGRWALGKPELHYWAPTYLGEREVPLYTTIGGFTQPGRRTIRVLVRELDAVLGEISGAWVELGAGCGTLTLPLAARAESVTAVETDPLAIAGLARSAAEAGLGARVKPLSESFLGRSAPLVEALAGASGLLVDPPRSGLGGFLTLLAEQARRPPRLIYVSCSAQSFVGDAAVLARLGYRAVSIRGIDQFPQTPHGEILADFRMAGS